ncbi:peptidoglycan-binding protein [Streptomyces sp. 769]|uniref:peptidoglycan-binding protein n=1 Tax=Streptomyces sp. 769 TaxID=1262452 RepID=UPI00057C98FA|nr:peptidoglycan-binding protein [Streptomyces sp. 769]AJC56486.1 phage protein [Streptomyces sp. 769]
MATPLTGSQLLAALRAEGLVVHEVRDWRRHNRNTKGHWGPMNGVVVHHTATEGTEPSVDLCYDGRPDLPGPLCHGVIDKAGEVHLVGNGRANHAGLGDRDVLQAVIDEVELPEDRLADTDGNRHFYGFECINLGDGQDPWPEAQLSAVEKAAAAICRAHGWGERSVIGHKEWQPGKIDPLGFTMDALRDRIKSRLAEPPEGPVDPVDPSPGAQGAGPGTGPTATNGSGGASDVGDVGAAGGTGGALDDGRTPPVPPMPQHPPYEPFPGGGFFRPGARDPVIAAMGERLIAEGCDHYRHGPGPEWNEAHRKSYASWQRKLGFHGKDADGVPGRVTWDRLRVPNTQARPPG